MTKRQNRFFITPKVRCLQTCPCCYCSANMAFPAVRSQDKYVFCQSSPRGKIGIRAYLGFWNQDVMCTRTNSKTGYLKGHSKWTRWEYTRSTHTVHCNRIESWAAIKYLQIWCIEPWRGSVSMIRMVHFASAVPLCFQCGTISTLYIKCIRCTCRAAYRVITRTFLHLFIRFKTTYESIW